MRSKLYELVTMAIRGIEKLEKDSPFFSRWMYREKRVRGRITQCYGKPNMLPSVTLEGFSRSRCHRSVTFSTTFTISKPRNRWSSFLKNLGAHRT